MKTWLVVVSVVAVLLAASTGVGVWILNDVKADLSSIRTELTGMQAELNEIKENHASPTYTLNVTVSPSASGTVSPSTGEYESGASIELIASPASGYTFDHWGGAISGSSSPVVTTMTSDKTVIAYFTPPPPEDCAEFPPGLIPWHEAKDHIGERVTVCGPVKSIYYCSTCKGKPTFLNIGEPHPDPDRFTVIIWGDNRGNFPEPPESYYGDKCICVTGLVVLYEDIAEIEVTSPDQIEIR